MKKYTLTLFVVLMSLVMSAQFDYNPTGRFDVPVKGMQWGLVGGGFTSMLTNRDDINEDERLDPQMMNFSYAGGIEFVYWFQQTIGFGAQALYWKGGAAYTGKDTISKVSMTGKTDLTYIKVPLLFHFKSYNRYYPDRRTRFTAMFGPYVALLNSYQDKAEFKNEKGETVNNINYSASSLELGLPGTSIKGSVSGSAYNPLDVGFVVGMGAEVRLWRRTVVALHVRTDIGILNVENTSKLKVVYDSDKTKEYDFSYWGGYHSKYNLPNAGDVVKGWTPNRPPTKNLSFGAFLSIRKYLAF